MGWRYYWIFIVLWIDHFLIIIWGRLPEEVPAHYNAYGAVDRWGSKWELLLLPGIGAFILLLMQTLEKFPEVHNYPKDLMNRMLISFI